MRKAGPELVNNYWKPGSLALNPAFLLLTHHLLLAFFGGVGGDGGGMSQMPLRNGKKGPGYMAPMAGASSQYTKVVGSILSQGTYKNQPMYAPISGTTN